MENTEELINIDDLPIEILTEIALEMGYPNFMELCRTSTQFNKFVCDSSDQYIWKRLFQKDFPNKISNKIKNWRKCYLKTRNESEKLESKIKTFIDVLQSMAESGINIPLLYILFKYDTKEPLYLDIPIIAEIKDSSRDFEDSEEWRLALFSAFETYNLLGPHYKDQIEALELVKEVINVVSEAYEEPENKVTKKQEEQIQSALDKCCEGKSPCTGKDVVQNCTLYDWYKIFTIFTRDQLLRNDFDAYLDITGFG